MFPFFKKNKKGYPEWLLAYESKSFAPSKNKEISHQTFCVLDCETTGLEKKDIIISVGALHLTGNEIKLSNLLDQKYPISKSTVASEIHGEIQAYPQKIDIQNYLKELIQFLDNHIIVGHYIAFDLAKINQMIRDFYPHFKLKNKVLDTGLLMKRVDNIQYERAVAGSEALQLDALCDTFRVPIENRHTALGDALMTALLFQHIVEKLKKRGVNKLKNLLKH